MKTNRFTIAGIFFLTCLGISSLAQNNKASEYIDFGGGVTFPMGTYLKGNYRVPGGYALPGSNFNFSFGVTPVHFPIGFALNAGYYFNRYDLDSYLKNHQTPDVSAVFGSNDPNISKLFYHGSFELAGIYKEFSVSDKMAFDIRLLAGDMGIATPAVSFYSIQQSKESTWNIGAQKAHTLSYNLGITTRFKPSNNFNISVNVDYLYSDFYNYTVDILYTGPGSGLNFSTTVPTTTISYGNGTGGSNSGGITSWGIGKTIGSKPYSTTSFGGMIYPPVFTVPTAPAPKVPVSAPGNQGVQHYRNSSNIIVSLLSLTIGVGINL